ncbi:MAG: nucleotide exchange factor GrpE [Halieaceae bacterium]
MAEQEQKQSENQESEAVAEEHAEAAAAAEAQGAASQPDESATEEGAEPTLEDVIDKLQTDLAQAEDASLRAMADAQNVKRRAEQDVEKARKFALEQFSKDLLPVVDNLERALDAAGGDEEAIKPIAEGVELTLKSFMDVMKKFHIEAVDPAGEPFDHELHQAIGMLPNADVEPNTVLDVMQKGYTLNGRLMRPAMVMVSKAAE